MLGQVAIEEESGKATNGIGFAVVDRGPRELLEIMTPAQAERWVAPIVRGEYREAWAVTEPGAGSDVAAVAATADRDGDEWVLNGEKWFVTSEGQPGFYVVLAVAEGEQTLFVVEPGTPGMEIVRTRASCTTRTSTITRRSSSATAAFPMRTAFPRAGTRAPRSGSRSSGCSSRHGAAGRPSGCWTWPRRSRASGRRSAARSSTTRESPSRSPTRSPSCSPPAC